MPIFSATQIGGALAAFIVLTPASVSSSDAPPPYASATEAYRQGVSAIKAGEPKEALPALEYAAGHGVLGARLKLARLYSKGGSIPKDHSKAFEYYQLIADQYADVPSSSPIARYVGEAFCALGRYYVDGIPDISLQPDPTYAAGLLRHAGAYFGDAEAQYRLGRLYLTGNGVAKSPTIAANWLTMAARKQHAGAQAVLGDMLWRGDGVRKRQAQGLALLMLAKENAAQKSPDGAGWIDESYARTIALADRPTVLKAEALMPRFAGGRGPSRSVDLPGAARAAGEPSLSAKPGPKLGPVDLVPPAAMGMSVGFGAADTGVTGLQ